MAGENVQCPLCKSKGEPRLVPRTNDRGQHIDCYLYTKCRCPDFYLFQYDAQSAGVETWSKEKLLRVRALLRERELSGLEPAVLQFTAGEDAPDIGEGVPVRVEDLLATWPDNVQERIERCLRNLANHYSAHHNAPGHAIGLVSDPPEDLVFLTEDFAEFQYIVEALAGNRWIRAPKEFRSGQRVNLWITPQGWAKYDELTHSRSNRKNPAFVAMWFGGKDRKKEMSKLFDEAIEPAVESAGYRAIRADREHHNEPIMGKIVNGIRISPFVVAVFVNEDGSDHSGVYYEAGFARGLGTEVIYCFHEDVDPHFDVGGVYHVKWKDKVGLQNGLVDRILGTGTIGKGPYKVEEE